MKAPKKTATKAVKVATPAAKKGGRYGKNPGGGHGGKRTAKNPNGSTGPKGITDDEVAEALRKFSGLVSQAAKFLQVDPSSLRERVRNNPALAKIREDSVEVIKDAVEGKFWKRLLASDKGNLNDEKFFLETFARDRGYGVRVEHVGKGGAALFPPGLLESLTDDELALFKSISSRARAAGETGS